MSAYEPLSEHLIPALTRQEVAQKVAGLNLASLEAEVGRIYSTRHLQGAGHPVDYLVEAADLTALDQILTPMLAAKYAMGWLASRRYLVVENAHLGLSFSVTAWRHLFATASGGTLVIELVNPLTGPSEALTQLAQLIAEYRDRVLVIFKVPMASRATQAAIRRAMPALLYVAIGFPALTRDGATAYITKQAELDRLTVDERLTAAVAALAFPTGHQALAAVYAKWRGDTLRQRDFPAYSVVGDTQAARAAAPTESDAAAKLAGLIGLSEVKALVNKVVSNFKMAQLRKARKLPVRQASMHMVFTGNPGTAKTTVARLLAQILRDQGVLRVGDLIEVGSADVVSQFVSATAPQVKDLFQRAAGSVLFIDEAYATVTEHGYGQEAIDTIVQEMENHRDDVVVIFAGYPAEMATFLDANPGLRSRVAYQIPFPDYAIEELVAIARLQLESLGLRLSDDAPKRLAAALTAIKTQDPKNFGNGRTVRNVLEKAVLNQGLRLDAAGGVPTNAALTELTGADFGDPAARRAQQPFEPARRIGFSAMLQAQ
ncbi:AAA family ATPase [Lacticaseibacillus kribbianus]|uniref:AAA family ATPase n=1 Tax=Lacticaseibacillus kribbianus TaxID=2926292 RepID=UPI001CD1BAA2|nr:AAA family ATPase [Lacticaseibacillus kribbianus]